MFLNTFLGAMINCVISHTAWLLSARCCRLRGLATDAYRLKVHRCELEKSSEEWRQPHATPPLGHDVFVEGLGMAVLSRLVVANGSPTSGECNQAGSHEGAKIVSISILDRLLWTSCDDSQQPDDRKDTSIRTFFVPG